MMQIIVAELVGIITQYTQYTGKLTDTMKYHS